MVKWLNAARHERELSIPEIADKLGMTEAEYANLEAGDGQEIIDNPELLYKLGDAFNIAPVTIFNAIFQEKAERRREDEKISALYGAALALQFAKEAYKSILSTEYWTDAENNDPKIKEAEDKLDAALRALPLDLDQRDSIEDAAYELSCAYCQLAFILGVEFQAGLSIMKTRPNPRNDIWGGVKQDSNAEG